MAKKAAREKQKIFCHECGERCISHPGRTFNGLTGKPNLQYLCKNSGCIKGRVNLCLVKGVHDFSGGGLFNRLFGLGSDNCHVCGSDNTAYPIYGIFG